VPSPASPPEGFHFNTCCPDVAEVCFKEDPGWRDVGGEFISARSLEDFDIVTLTNMIYESVAGDRWG